MEKEDSFKKLHFNQNYESFGHFYSSTNDVIYKTVFDVFSEFKKTEKSTLKITVDAIIDNFEWGTDLIFTKDNYKILKTVLIPYYEKTEDFEFCRKIDTLYKQLTTT